MKVERTVKIDVNTFKVGDIIKFKLTDGTKVKAIAVQKDAGDMIFCLASCLPSKVSRMNKANTNKGGYEESYLRQRLNSEFLKLFPEDMIDMMVPFENGDLLRIPTEKEMFGTNKYGEFEAQHVKQWKPMKKRKNRMAFDSAKGESLQWYWLMNKARESTIYFSFVDRAGYEACDAPFISYGVRPVFKIKNF